jgi:hypothetical protein
MSSGAIGSKTAARPGGTGRGAPHATQMSQPWTVISMAPVTATMLAVPDGDPPPGGPGRGAGAQQPGCLPGCLAA